MQHAASMRDVLAGVALARGVQHHAARGIDLGLAVGEHRLDELELGDRLAELLALERVAHRVVRSARSATPTQTAAMCRRPRSSTFIAVLKPSPSLPPSSAVGRHAAVRRRSRRQVCAPRWPIFGRACRA